MEYRFTAANLLETIEFATVLSKYLDAGSVIGLDGDLGAGKTAFSQGVAKAIGVREIVNSPTFTIIKEYQGSTLPFYHMDVYRISLEEAEELGLDEYFYGAGVTMVEWASRIAEILPAERLSVFIENFGAERRVFHVTPVGDKYEHWCSVMLGMGVLQ